MIDRETLTAQNVLRAHPDYVANRHRWQTISDFLAEDVDLRTVLPKGKLEEPSNYAARVKLSAFCPESTDSFQTFLGSLFSQPVDRKNVDRDPVLKDWSTGPVHKRTGLGYSDFIQFMVAPRLGAYGSTLILLDRSEDGAAPNLIAYPPLNVWNWGTGPDGGLSYVTISEEIDLSEPFAARASAIRVYLLDGDSALIATVTLSEKGLQRSKNKDVVPEWNAHGECTNWEDFTVDFGEVLATELFPVEYLTDSERVTGSGVLHQAIQLDLQAIQLDSDQQWNLYVHGRSPLVIKTNRQLGELNVGATEYLKLDPDANESAEYLPLPLTPFAIRSEEMERKHALIHKRVLGSVTANTEGDAGQPLSGVSRAYAFEVGEGRHLRRYANILCKAENGVLSKVAKMMGSNLELDEKTEQWVTYTDKFFPLDAGLLLEDAPLFRTSINSDTAQRSFQKKLVVSILPELTTEQRDDVDKEIEAAPMGPQGLDIP